MFLFYRSYLDVEPQFHAKESPYKGAAEFLKVHTNEHEVVYTCDWDDAPELFFYNHKDYYLLFLDPIFLYGKDPVLWDRWRNLSEGKYYNQTYNILKDEFKVKFGVCTSDFQDLKEIIKKDSRFKIPYDSQDNFVFELR